MQVDGAVVTNKSTRDVVVVALDDLNDIMGYIADPDWNVFVVVKGNILPFDPTAKYTV